MTFSVSMTSQAEDDLFRNAEWWAKNRSLEEAVAWMALVREQVSELSTFPQSQSLAPENADYPYELRQLLVACRAYRVVFTIRQEEVLVLAILRVRQNYMVA